MNKQNRNRLIDAEIILTVARWEGCWGEGWVRKVKGLRSANC